MVVRITGGMGHRSVLGGGGGGGWLGVWSIKIYQNAPWSNSFSDHRDTATGVCVLNFSKFRLQKTGTLTWVCVLVIEQYKTWEIPANFRQIRCNNLTEILRFTTWQISLRYDSRVTSNRCSTADWIRMDKSPGSSDCRLDRSDSINFQY